MLNQLTEILEAYRLGVDDGYYAGVERDPDEITVRPSSDEERHAYRLGYDHGVRLYCDSAEGEPEESNAD